MKRIVFSLAFLTCLFHANYGSATVLPIHCTWQDCFTAGIEYLYLKPTIHDPYFVIPEGGPGNTDEPRGKRFANELDYHSGVRGALGYGLLDCPSIVLYAEGLYISDKDSRRLDFGTTAPLALGTKGNPLADLDSVMNATSCIDYCLWSAKGGFRYCFETSCLFLLAAHLNVHYAHLKFDESIFYTESGNTVDADYLTETCAVGPEFGVDFGFRLTNCLSFVTRGSYSLLVGWYDMSHQQTRCILDTGVIQDDVDVVNQTLCGIIPALEWKVGLNYNLCLGCFLTEIEIGFDMIRYTDMIDRIRWIGDNEESQGLSLDYFSPFSLHGLYVSINTTF